MSRIIRGSQNPHGSKPVDSKHLDELKEEAYRGPLCITMGVLNRLSTVRPPVIKNKKDTTMDFEVYSLTHS